MPKRMALSMTAFVPRALVLMITVMMLTGTVTIMSSTVHLYSNRYYLCDDVNCRDERGARFVTQVPANSPPPVFLNLKCGRCNNAIDFRKGRRK